MLFDENADNATISPSRAATGPRAGFLRAFETSFNAQTRGAAVFGIQDAMRNREDAQRRALRAAGVENIPSISQQSDDPLRAFTDFGQDYIDSAKFYENGGDPKIGVRLREYDKRVEALRQQYPDLKLETSIEMWRSVKAEAQKYEERAAFDRKDFGGVVGEFVGGAVGALNPNTDPLNFATLPVGGPGKTAVGRIAVQGGAQGITETINQLTGVQEQRRLLGLDYGLADATQRVAGAVIGGAAVQGAGEVLAAGLRRVFPNRVRDPVPDVPLDPPAPRVEPAPLGVVPDEPAAVAATYQARPQAYYDFMDAVNANVLAGTRAGKARFRTDVEFADAQLRAWDGPTPIDLAPRTDTADVNAITDFSRIVNLDEKGARGDLDAAARRVDPETMGRYDALADEKRALRERIDMFRDVRDDVGQDATVADLNDKIGELDARIARASAKNRKRLGKEREALVAERDAARQAFLTSDTPAMAAVRERLVKVDEKMRDLAELVGRAYAHARGKWDTTEGERAAIRNMIREGNKAVSEDYRYANDLVSKAQDVPQPVDVIPALAERPADMKADADLADVQMRVYEQRAQAAEERAAVGVSETTRLLKEAEKLDEMTPQERSEVKAAVEPGQLAPGQFKVDGYETVMSLDDRIMYEDADGNIVEGSIRDVMETVRDSDEDLKAVQSCSVR